MMNQPADHPWGLRLAQMMVQRKDKLMELLTVQKLAPFSVSYLVESLTVYCLELKRELKLGTFWDVAMEMLSQLVQGLAQATVQTMDYRLERSKVHVLVVS
jgi:hypothetical protein